MKERRPSTEPEYLIAPIVDADGVQVSSGIGRDGREYPDPVPMSPPVGYQPPTQLEQLIERVLQRRDFLAAVRAADFETPDEADDFEVDEDYDPRFAETIYEAYFEAKSKRAAARAAQEVNPQSSMVFRDADRSDQKGSADLVSEPELKRPVEKSKSVAQQSETSRGDISDKNDGSLPMREGKLT